MAKVNRYFKQADRQLIDPISLQEAMVVPGFMREQHNQMAQMAAQNSVLDSDALAQDEAAVRQVLDPIEEGYNNLASDLAKNGYSREKATKMLDLQGEKARVERDYLSKIKGRKQAVTSKAQEIKEFYKDNPQIAQAKINELYNLNTAKTTIDENGNINVPGVSNPFVAKVYDSNEITKMVGDSIGILKKNLQTETNINFTGNDIYAILNEATKAGVDQGRILQMMKSTLGQDVIDSYKVRASVAGVGMSRFAPNDEKLVAADRNSAINSFKEQRDQSLNNMLYAKMQEHASLNDGKFPSKEQKEQYKKEIEGSQEFLNKQASIDANIASIQSGQMSVEQVSQLAINNFANNRYNDLLMGSSAAAEYTERINKYSLTAKPGAGGSGNSAEDYMKFWSLGSGGIFSTEAFNRFTFDVKSVGGIQQIKKEALENVLIDNGYVKGDDGKFTLNGAPYSDSQLLGLPENAVNKEVTRLTGLYENPETNTEFTSFVAGNTQLKLYTNKHGYKKTAELVDNFYTNIQKNHSLVYEFPVKSGKTEVQGPLTEKYKNKLPNLKIINREGKQQSLQELVSDSGHGNTPNFYKEANFQLLGIRYLPGQGMMMEASYIKSGDNGATTILLEPDAAIESVSSPLRKLSEATNTGETVVYPITLQNNQTGEYYEAYRVIKPNYEFQPGSGQEAFNIYDIDATTDKPEQLMNDIKIMASRANQNQNLESNLNTFGKIKRVNTESLIMNTYKAAQESILKTDI